MSTPLPQQNPKESDPTPIIFNETKLNCDGCILKHFFSGNTRLSLSTVFLGYEKCEVKKDGRGIIYDSERTRGSEGPQDDDIGCIVVEVCFLDKTYLNGSQGWFSPYIYTMCANLHLMYNPRVKYSDYERNHSSLVAGLKHKLNDDTYSFYEFIKGYEGDHLGNLVVYFRSHFFCFDPKKAESITRFGSSVRFWHDSLDDVLRGVMKLDSRVPDGYDSVKHIESDVFVDVLKQATKTGGSSLVVQHVCNGRFKA